MPDLSRFVDAQNGVFETALTELEAGRKRSHWMWYIFPQLAFLGRSATAQYYGLADIAEARAYAAHPVLGPRLAQCAEALLRQPHSDPVHVMGEVDALKLRSSATLFRAAGGPQVTAQMQSILDRFFAGAPCPLTIGAME